MRNIGEPPPRNIIVRMPNWVGDLVMATAILTDLRRAFPEAKITAMAREPICELLEEDREIDELFTFSKVGLFSRHSDRRSITQKLREAKYDLGLLLTHSFSSAWWFWQGGVKQRIGFPCNGRRLLLTHPVPLPDNLEDQHLVVTYKMLLAPLGIPLSNSKPRLFLTDEEMQEAQKLLRDSGVPAGATLVGIHPGATYGSAKCWLPERFREVTEELLKDPDLYLLYFGDAASIPVVKQICRGLPSRVINFAGLTSLRELAALIQQCTLLLTNDSGPMHIADALGTPLVALFGSTSDVVTGPYRSSGKVIHKHVSCSPCYQRTCPIDFRCMRQISSQEVVEEMQHILRQRHSKLPTLK